MAERSFDLVVLCSSLPDHECERVVELARTQNSQPKVLTLCAAGRQSCGNRAGDELMEEVEPLALIRKSAAMLGFEMKRNGRGIAESRLAETGKL